MFGEIVKILSDEPEKVEKAVIRAIKVFLNLFIAAFFYKSVVSSFYVIQLDSYKEWSDFLLSGRVLICLFFYFFSAYIIFSVFNTIISVLLNWIANRKLFKIANDDIITPLKFLGIIKINKSEKIPLPGRNIDILYKGSQLFSDKESVEEIRTLKNTLVENVVNLYFMFVLLYFFLIDKDTHTLALSWFIIIGLILVILVYIGVHSFIEFMIENHSKIFSSLSFIKVIDQVSSILKDYGIYPEKLPVGSGLNKCKAFNLRNKEYILAYIPYGKRASLDEIESLLSKSGKPGRVFILISPKEFIGDTQELALKFHDSFIPVIYSDEKNLEAQFKQTIESIIR